MNKAFSYYFDPSVKIIGGLTLMIILSGEVFGQILSDRSEYIEIGSISSEQENFSDLQALTSLWSDKRIILLGEQSHGDGATFEARVRLIKFLHQEMGFDMIAFESGMFDNFHAYQKLLSDKETGTSFLKKSILSIWSETAENQRLVDYAVSTTGTASPLQISGFDFIRNDFYKYKFWDEIKGEIIRSGLSESDLSLFEEVIGSGSDPLLEGTIDSIEFFSKSKTILSLLTRRARQEPSEKNQMLAQCFKTWVFGVKYELRERLGVRFYVQNPRDAQMAENLIFLSELYPDKKIICIGASMHFSNQVLNFRNTDLTKEYISRLSKPEDDKEVFDLDKEMEGAIPMGQLLKTHFKDQMYSLAFSSYDGDYGIIGAENLMFPVPPKESLEAELVRKDFERVVLNFKKDSFFSEWFYLSALGNLPVYAKWETIFDGLFFIKTSYQPNPIEYDLVTISSSENDGRIYGRIIDQDSKHVMPFVNISLMGTSEGVSSNEKGEFVFSENDTPDSRLVFSSIGYENDTILISDFEKKRNVVIRMVPKSYMLSEVVISDKPLTAESIIKKARERKNENYFQLPMNQEFFFSSTHYNDDSITFNEESAVLLYGEQGYKSTNNPSGHFYGNILQYRNTTSNPSKDKWSGVGSMWLVLTHDIILDKANVLNRTNSYNLEISGVKEYNGHLVYEISFVCKRPSATTTGFGYSSPIAATGKIFIDTDNYAILRYELCVSRQKFERPKRNLILDPWGHRLIQTFKNYQGKYFLNTSISYDDYKYHNTEKNTSWNYSHLAILNSTNIEINNVRVIEKPIRSIAVGKMVKEDPEFWKSHNYIISNKDIPQFNCE